MQTHLVAEPGSLPKVPGSRDSIQSSHWINEPLPDLRTVLTSHDVCRLTRRPRWFLYGLLLLGQFPQRRTFHGRPFGWHRDDVLAWLGRDLTVSFQQQPGQPACARKRSDSIAGPCARIFLAQLPTSARTARGMNPSSATHDARR